MSLVVKARGVEKSDFTSFYLYDATGLYKALEPHKNLTGYNTPNPLIASATAATATITLPDAITLLPTGDPVVINVYSLTTGLPSVTGRFYEILATDLGYSDGLLPDGQYKIVYTVTIAAVEYTYTLNQIFLGRTCCCIQQALAEYDVCNCKKENTCDKLYGSLLLKVIRRQIACAKNHQAIETLKELKAICNREGCKNC